MPRSRKNGDRLTLDLEGPKVSSDRFRRAINAFLDLIDEVSREVSGGKASVRWLVSVKPGSVHLSATPEALRPQAPVHQITRIIRTGISAIEKRAVRPRYFTDMALQKIRDIANTADGKEIRKAKIQVEARSLSVSQRTATHVDTILATTVSDMGTIEGELRMLTIQGGFKFNLYDDLTDKAVECHITENLLSNAHKAFGKRVAVTGLIRYRPDGEPVNIEVEDITAFPDNDNLPTADDVYGILSKSV